MSDVLVKKSRFADLPFPALALGLIILAIAARGPNADLAFGAIGVLIAGFILLWRPGESAVLLMTFVLHWTGASAAIFHANMLGIDVAHYGLYGGDMRTACALTLEGLLALALGMRLCAGAWRQRDSTEARAIAASQPVHRWFQLYVFAWATSFVVLSFASLVPGLSQVMLATASLKWAFYFMLACAAFNGGLIGIQYFLIALIMELASSLGSYFSDFKSAFLFAIFAVFLSGSKITLKFQTLLGILTVLLIGFSVIWSEVKQEYRDFLSGGQHEQIVTVGYRARLDKLVELVEAIDRNTVAEGTDRLLRRLSYTEFFGIVLGYVPEYLPHEDGALFADALLRPFMPRIFFPEKAIINDTQRTSLYTGGMVDSADGGTSISLGYMAESYIDFGPYAMMPALFGIGCCLGFLYRFFLRQAQAGALVGMAMASAVLANVGGLDSSFTKMFGGLVVSGLVAWLISRSLLPRYAGWAMARRADTRGMVPAQGQRRAVPR